jgi:hypothetical protein
MLNWGKRHETILLLIILSVLLRLPSLFEPYWYGDEGIYLTLGQALRKGLVWYRDIHDNKPPLLYLLAAITGTVFWFRLLLMFWFGAAVAVFYRLSQKLLPARAPAGTIATLLLITLTTMFEGNVANAEIFIVLPVCLGMLLALKSRPNWWLVGFCFSLGFLFKAPAAFDFFALLLWFFLNKKTKIKNLLRCGLSFSLPIILSIGYYAYQGAFTPYVRSALLQNIGYLQTWGSSSEALFIRFGIALIISLIAFRSLSLLWFTWAMFGALLSARPYPHYLIQPAIPLGILITEFFFRRNRRRRILIIGVVMIAVVAYRHIRFWQYPVIEYYQNWLAYVAGGKSREDYWRWFKTNIPQTYRLAEYIRRTTQPDQAIFIWGDEPQIYALSRRLPPGRYTVAYHVLDFDGFRETLEAWDRRQPKVVAVMNDGAPVFPGLDTRLSTDYILAQVFDSIEVYRLIKGVN